LLSFAHRKFICGQNFQNFVPLSGPAAMGPHDHKPPGNRKCYGHAVDSHPPSTSSTLGAREYVRVRGLDAFPANIEIARTIASLRGMSGVNPIGRAIAVGAANTGGVSCVWCYSFGHTATSLQN
jgi:hypothetical protein